MAPFRISKSALVLVTLAIILSVTIAINGFSSPEVVAQITGTVIINNGSGYTNSTTVTLNLSCESAVDMQFSNDNTTWSDWEPYDTTRVWNLSDLPEGADAAQKTVFVNFDTSNQIVSASATVIVDPVPPLPFITIQVSSVENNELLFDGSYSEDNIGIVSYVWNFGDGNTTNGMTVTHAYSTYGNFTGALTITDEAGNTATTSFWVKIPITTTSTPTTTPTPTSTPVIQTPKPTVTVMPSTQPSPTVPGFAVSTITLVVILAVAAIIFMGIVIVVVISRSKPKSTN